MSNSTNSAIVSAIKELSKDNTVYLTGGAKRLFLDETDRSTKDIDISIVGNQAMPSVEEIEGLITNSLGKDAFINATVKADGKLIIVEVQYLDVEFAIDIGSFNRSKYEFEQYGNTNLYLIKREYEFYDKLKMSMKPILSKSSYKKNLTLWRNVYDLSLLVVPELSREESNKILIETNSRDSDTNLDGSYKSFINSIDPIKYIDDNLFEGGELKIANNRIIHFEKWFKNNIESGDALESFDRYIKVLNEVIKLK